MVIVLHYTRNSKELDESVKTEVILGNLYTLTFDMLLLRVIQWTVASGVYMNPVPEKCQKCGTKLGKQLIASSGTDCCGEVNNLDDSYAW